MSPETNWVVKASKFCNINCLYCYEWDYLNDKNRISLEQWERLFLNALRHSQIRSDASGGKSCDVNIIWHGGEPLALPVDYIEDVLTIQSKVFENHSGKINNHVQTNLFQTSDKTIDFIANSGFGVGVSFDGVSGMRLTRSKKTTEEVVLQNMEKLRKRGVSFGGICVVASHNWDKMQNVSRFFSDNNIDFRALKLMSHYQNENHGKYSIDLAQTLHSFYSISDYYLGDDCKIQIAPIQGLTQAVLRKKMNLPVGQYDRKIHQDSLFIVETDGSLYLHREAGEIDNSLGNIFTSNIDDILESSAYEKSLIRDKEITSKYCESCEYNNYCDSLPVLNDEVLDKSSKHCEVSYSVMKYIEDKYSGYLVENIRNNNRFVDYSDSLDPSCIGSTV